MRARRGHRRDARGVGPPWLQSTPHGRLTEVHSCIQSKLSMDFFWVLGLHGGKRHVSLFPLRVLHGFVHPGKIRHFDWMQECTSHVSAHAPPEAPRRPTPLPRGQVLPEEALATKLTMTQVRALVSEDHAHEITLVVRKPCLAYAGTACRVSSRCGAGYTPVRNHSSFDAVVVTGLQLHHVHAWHYRRV